jgi:Zinc knuckle
MTQRNGGGIAVRRAARRGERASAICYRCRDVGHHAKDCPDRESDSERETSHPVQDGPELECARIACVVGEGLVGEPELSSNIEAERVKSMVSTALEAEGECPSEAAASCKGLPLDAIQPGVECGAEVEGSATRLPGDAIEAEDSSAVDTREVHEMKAANEELSARYDDALQDEMLEYFTAGGQIRDFLPVFKGLRERFPNISTEELKLRTRVAYIRAAAVPEIVDNLRIVYDGKSKTRHRGAETAAGEAVPRSVGV